MTYNVQSEKILLQINEIKLKKKKLGVAEVTKNKNGVIINTGEGDGKSKRNLHGW